MAGTQRHLTTTRTSATSAGQNRPDDDPIVGELTTCPHPTIGDFVDDVSALSNYLLSRALSLTAQRADAEDLVQDTLLKAYLAVHLFRAGTNLKAWLNAIMVNLWVDTHRRRQRRPTEMPSGDLGDLPLATRASRARHHVPSAEHTALSSLPTAVGNALRTLPEDLRHTVYYADVQGYRNTEIAELLHIPVGTVGSRLHRGRNMLRTTLTQHCA